jgi:hypothetical protein
MSWRIVSGWAATGIFWAASRLECGHETAMVFLGYIFDRLARGPLLKRGSGIL